MPNVYNNFPVWMGLFPARPPVGRSPKNSPMTEISVSSVRFPLSPEITSVEPGPAILVLLNKCEYQISYPKSPEKVGEDTAGARKGRGLKCLQDNTLPFLVLLVFEQKHCIWFFICKLYQMYALPIAAVKNYHTLVGFERHKFIMFRFCRSEAGPQVSLRSNQGGGMAVSLAGGSRRDPFPCLFLLRQVTFLD